MGPNSPQISWSPHWGAWVSGVSLSGGSHQPFDRRPRNPEPRQRRGMADSWGRSRPRPTVGSNKLEHGCALVVLLSLAWGWRTAMFHLTGFSTELVITWTAKGPEHCGAKLRRAQQDNVYIFEVHEKCQKHKTNPTDSTLADGIRWSLLLPWRV